MFCQYVHLQICSIKDPSWQATLSAWNRKDFDHAKYDELFKVVEKEIMRSICWRSFGLPLPPEMGNLYWEYLGIFFGGEYFWGNLLGIYVQHESIDSYWECVGTANFWDI